MDINSTLVSVDPCLVAQVLEYRLGMAQALPGVLNLADTAVGAAQEQQRHAWP